MKKFIIFFLTAIAGGIAAQAQIAPYPQVPATFNYQGVARNSAGMPLANQIIKVYSSIITPPGGGFALNRFFIEKRTVTTNQFGLFNIQIGSPGADSVVGTIPTNSTFMAYTNLNLHTDIVLPNTSALISLGDTKLASVPYSLYARAARPWAYTSSETTIPMGTNFTIYPDKDYWNLGLGTAEATEKLHVKGRIRMEDGAQAAGFVMTSDANGVASWKPNGNISPWAKGGNRTFLITNTDSVGIGITNPTAKLHVAGKFRLADGTQSLGYNLVSDNNGLASWQKPNWTEYSNNIGTGYNIIYTTDINKTVGIGTATPDNSVKLHVDGGLRLTGNGPLVPNNVLTVDGSGNAVWKSIGENISSYWVPGFRNGRPTVETRPVLDTQTFYSNSRFIVSKQILPSFVLDHFNPNNYPLQVEGSKHGMAIKVNGASDKNNKFIGFFDGTNGFKGAIEGQTVLDLQNDPEYTVYVSINTLAAGAFIAEGIACGFQVDLFEVAVQAAQAAVWAADLGATIALKEGNAGVAYASGAGDYAEWLEKADPTERFSYGDIVSVNGGKITKAITGGGQLMVISRAPIVLGNMPDENKKADYEKVAFMGQVPVKVKGKVAIGDYIVASLNGDGFGYAANSAKITTEEMPRIAGVAWSASGKGEISLINTAVGLNTNATTNIIKKQEEEISLLKNSINQLSAYLQSKDASFNYTKLDAKPVTIEAMVKPVTINKQPSVANVPAAIAKSFSNQSPEEQIKKLNKVSVEKVLKLINEHPQYLDAVMKIMKEKTEARNQDLNSNPQLKRMLTDRAFMIETIKKAYSIS